MNFHYSSYRLIVTSLMGLICCDVCLSQQAGLLLDELPKCGARAFQEFVDALDSSKTPVHQQLSKKLRDMANVN